MPPIDDINHYRMHLITCKNKFKHMKAVKEVATELLVKINQAIPDAVKMRPWLETALTNMKSNPNRNINTWAKNKLAKITNSPIDLIPGDLTDFISKDWD